MGQTKGNLVGRQPSPCLLPTQILEPTGWWCRFRDWGGAHCCQAIDSYASFSYSHVTLAW